MNTKNTNNDLTRISPMTMSSNTQTSTFSELPRVGSFNFMEAAMQALSLIRNKSQELCRDLMAQDPHRISYEKRCIKEDSAKFRAIVEKQKMEAFKRLEAR